MALLYEPIAIVLNIIFVSIIAFSCFRLMWKWRHRTFLAIDFFGMGSSYLVLLVWGFLWFLTLNRIYFFLMAVWSVFWVAALSYALLRIAHPTEKRPANWGLLMYLSVPVVWVVTKDMWFASLHILLISALVTFTSSLFLLTHCKKSMKRNGLAGMIVGIISASYVPILMADVFPLTLQTGLLVFVPVNLLLAYILFGFLQMSNKSPKEFLCDYDHKKDGRRK